MEEEETQEEAMIASAHEELGDTERDCSYLNIYKNITTKMTIVMMKMKMKKKPKKLCYC